MCSSRCSPVVRPEEITGAEKPWLQWGAINEAEAFFALRPPGGETVPGGCRTCVDRSERVASSDFELLGQAGADEGGGNLAGHGGADVSAVGLGAPDRLDPVRGAADRGRDRRAAVRY